MDLAAILGLVATTVAVVAILRSAPGLAAVALIAMVAVVPAAQAESISSGDHTSGTAKAVEPTTAETAVGATTAGATDATSTTEPDPTTTTAPAEPPTTTTTPPTATTTTTSTTTKTTTSVTTAARRKPAPRRGPATRPREDPVTPAGRAEQVEAIADESGWNWRRAGIVIHLRYHPEECCAWGVYDYRDSSIWIGPTAFASTTRLRYVVLHELGHAWQWHSGHLDTLAADMAPWGYGGTAGLEAGADCISVAWGASAKAGHYWSCRSAAASLVARRLAGDWN